MKIQLKIMLLSHWCWYTKRCCVLHWMDHFR